MVVNERPALSGGVMSREPDPSQGELFEASM
jgi:hypothetical protein